MSRPTERWITPLVRLMLTVGYVYVLRDVFGTHRFMLTHDTVVDFAPYQFAFTGMPNDALLLQSAEKGSRRQPEAFATPSPSRRRSTAAALTSIQMKRGRARL